MKQERMAPMKGSVGIVLLGAVLASLALVRATPSAPKITVHRFGKLTQKNGLLPHRIALSTIRGGYSDQSPGDGVSASGTCASQEYQMPPPQAPQPQQYGYPTDQEPPNKGENVPFEETFQQKVDTWRQYQMEHAEEQRSSLSPRDGQGRMKLLTSVGKGSRAITFFICKSIHFLKFMAGYGINLPFSAFKVMWRNVHLYEVVDSRYKGSVRYMGVFPLTFLFIANLAGVVASVSSAGSSSKKRLKVRWPTDKKKGLSTRTKLLTSMHPHNRRRF